MNTRESDFWNERSGPRIAPEFFGDIVATAADMALVVAESGRIISVTTNPLNSGLGRIEHWEGRDVREFLAPDSVQKVENQLVAVLRNLANRPDAIEVNHQDGAYWDFPVRYTLHPTGRDGRVLMLGRDMRPLAELQQRLVKAQLALEKDYENQRQHETRYRVLMAQVADAVVMVDAGTGRITDINPPAARALNGTTQSLVGTAFTQCFEGRRRAEFIDALSAASSRGAAIPEKATLRDGGGAVSIRAHLFRNGGERTLLCRIEAPELAPSNGDETAEQAVAVLAATQDGLVCTSRTGAIEQVNDAFLAMVGAGTPSQVEDRDFADFLVRGTIDMKVLTDRDRPRIFATRLRAESGMDLPVEITVADLPDGGHGFLLRDAAGGSGLRANSNEALLPDSGSQTQATGLVGSVPLRDIVASMTDVIEKQCIEAAIDLTNNNRVAAAEMLGLSRQSLYVKLRKYDLLTRDDG